MNHLEKAVKILDIFRSLRREDDLYHPRIVDLKKPILVVGLSMHTDVKKVYKDLDVLGQELLPLRAKIKNKKSPWTFVAVTRNYNSVIGEWDYVLGDVVNGFKSVPKGLVQFAIPEGKYAVITVTPHPSLGWGKAIGNAKRFMFNRWFPRSPYTFGRDICDFEYHEEKSTSKNNPQMDLYFALAGKNGSESTGVKNPAKKLSIKKIR